MSSSPVQVLVVAPAPIAATVAAAVSSAAVACTIVHEPAAVLDVCAVASFDAAIVADNPQQSAVQTLALLPTALRACSTVISDTIDEGLKIRSAMAGAAYCLPVDTGSREWSKHLDTVANDPLATELRACPIPLTDASVVGRMSWLLGTTTAFLNVPAAQRLDLMWDYADDNVTVEIGSFIVVTATESLAFNQFTSYSRVTAVGRMTLVNFLHEAAESMVDNGLLTRGEEPQYSDQTVALDTDVVAGAYAAHTSQ